MKIDGSPFIVICYFFLFLTAIVINKKIKFVPASFRFESIDGLRGLLATGVLIHHLIIWFNYLHTDVWRSPNNPIAVLLGKGSVFLFFMITAFLFTNKILREKNQDNSFWKSILYSRIYRLSPAYFLLILFVILLALINSSFSLKVSFLHFLNECFQWFTFTIIGAPPINTVNASPFSAGVTWSLPYEWLFYFLLPLLAIALTRKVNGIAIVCALLFTGLYFTFNRFEPTHLYPFIGGIIPALILKYKPKINLNKPIFSIAVIVIFCLFIVLRKFLNLYTTNTLLIFIFIIISLGNDMFGLLKLRFLSLLGEISYSTYLFHGMVIYITFHLIGFEYLKKSSSSFYIITSILICFMVVIISYLSYYYIEKRGIDFYKSLNKKAKN